MSVQWRHSVHQGFGSLVAGCRGGRKGALASQVWFDPYHQPGSRPLREPQERRPRVPSEEGPYGLDQGC